MGERSTSSAFGPLPRGLLGAILLVLMIERFVEKKRAPVHPARILGLEDEHPGDPARVRDCQVLCFGTSISQQGLLPRIIDERTGWRTYNLAVCWGQAAGHYYLLKQALASGARPKAVVIESHPQCLSGDLYQAIRFWPEMLHARDVVELAWTARDADFLATTLLACWLPSIKDRFSLRSNILDALKGAPNPYPAQTLVYVRNKNRNRGSIINGKNPAYQGAIAPTFENGLTPDGWSCDPINATYLRRFFRLAQERGITVYWLMNPYSPALSGATRAKGARRAVFPIRPRVSRRVLESRGPRRAACRLRPDRLHRRGASRPGRGLHSSADVGDAVRAHTQGSSRRWVELPAFGVRPTAAVVEDLAESALARAGGGAKRR